MSSTVVKRSIVIAGHKTSVSLEDAFWEGLSAIARSRQMMLSRIVATICSEHPHGNRSSAIRLFVLDCYRELANAHAHRNPAASATPGLTPVRPPAR